MKKIITGILLCGLSGLLWSQEIRSSLMLYQFNALPINPAYTSKLDATGFTAAYFGSFTSDNLVSRSALVNLQGATERGGIGLTFQFYKTSFFGEASIRPAWSRRFTFRNGSCLALGAAAGFNYFDVQNFILTNVEGDFVSFDGSAGAYFYSPHFFAGFSAMNFFETSLGLEDSGSNTNLLRENPYVLHTGGLFRLYRYIQLNPVVLGKYIQVYQLPKDSPQVRTHQLSLDFQANFVIDETYVAGLLVGFTDPETGSSIRRFGASFTLLLDHFRLGYGIQDNSRSNNAVSLPASHLIIAGYDFGGMEEEPVRRFF